MGHQWCIFGEVRGVGNLPLRGGERKLGRRNAKLNIVTQRKCREIRTGEAQIAIDTEGQGRHLHHRNRTEKGEGVGNGEEEIPEIAIREVANATERGDDPLTVVTDQSEIDHEVRAASLAGDMGRRRDADTAVEGMNMATAT